MPVAVITNYSEEFSAAWLRIVPQLRRRLLRRGVPDAVIDDVVQETAVAALCQRVPFDDAAELLAWSTTVSRRLAIADYRRRARERDAPVQIDHVDHVERDVLARIDLDRVLEAARGLTSEEWAALSTVTSSTDRREAVRLNVRRHRARKKLLLLAGGFNALGAALGVLRRLRSLAPAAVAAPAMVAVVLLGVVMLRPEDGGRLPPRAGASTDPAAAPPGSMPSSPPGTAAVTDGAAGPDRTPRATDGAGAETTPSPPSPTRRERELDVPVGGDGAYADTRPKAPDEPTTCVAAPMGGACVDVPFPATPLDDVSVSDLLF